MDNNTALLEELNGSSVAAQLIQNFKEDTSWIATSYLELAMEDVSSEFMINHLQNDTLGEDPVTVFIFWQDISRFCLVTEALTKKYVFPIINTD